MRTSYLKPVRLFLTAIVSAVVPIGLLAAAEGPIESKGLIEVEIRAGRVSIKEARVAKKVSLPLDDFVISLTTALAVEHWYYKNESEDFRFEQRRADSSLTVASAVQRRFEKQMRLLKESIEFFQSLTLSTENLSRLSEVKDRAQRFGASALGQAGLAETNQLIAQILRDVFAPNFKNGNGAKAQTQTRLLIKLKSSQTRPYLVIRSWLSSLPKMAFRPVDFTLGSTDPKARPTKARIELGQMGVTQAVWFTVTGTNPSFFDQRIHCPNSFTDSWGVPRCPELPVESVALDRLADFLRRLNWLDRHYRYRLPLDREREAAQRENRVGAAASEDDLKKRAWYLHNAKLQPQPVGSKSPNGQGFFDLQGNLWEVVKDTSPQASDQTFTVTGGSWLDELKLTQIGFYSRLPVSWICYDVGLRLARERP